MSQPLSAHLSEMPRPYYFNASRWVCTSKSDLPITWYYICSGDWQGITFTKVIKIAALFIFAFVYDLIRMTVDRCFPNRIIIQQENYLRHQKENTAILEQYISPDLLPMVLANLNAYEAAFYFEQTPKMQTDAERYRNINFNKVSMKVLKCIQQLPNPERLYSNIRGLELYNDSMTDAEFLALVGLLSKAKIRTLDFPQNPLGGFHSYDTAVKALEQMDQSELRKIYFQNLRLTNEEFLQLLSKIPSLNEILELPDSIPDGTMIQVLQRFRNSLESVELIRASDACFEELVLCPQLKKLILHQTIHHQNIANIPHLQLAQRGQLTSLHLKAGSWFSFSLIQEFCKHCSLTELTLAYGNYDEDLSKLFELSRQLLFFRRVIPLKNNDLRALANHCPNLTSLSLSLSNSQTRLFLDLLPQWKNLTHLALYKIDIDELSLDVNLGQIVNAIPLLKSLSFIMPGDPPRYLKEEEFFLNVIEQLGALNRQLTLYIEDSNTPKDTARRNKLFNQFPQLEVVLLHFLNQDLFRAR